MSSAAQVMLKNRTGEIQRAFVGGHIHQLLPYQTREFEAPVAGAFLEQRSGFVTQHAAARIPIPAPGEQIIWVANVTGNPFLPDKVTLVRFRKGEEERYEVDNPLRSASVISRRYCGGQRVQPTPKDPYSRESLNISGGVVEIPPYTRAPVGRDLAEWMLRRDGQQSKHHVGKLIQCRAPAEFEPNEAWSTSRLRFYGSQLLDIPEPMLDAIVSPDANLTDAEQRVHLLRLMFFRLVDHRWNLPSREDFHAIWEARAGNPNRIDSGDGKSLADRVKDAKMKK